MAKRTREVVGGMTTQFSDGVPANHFSQSTGRLPKEAKQRIKDYPSSPENMMKWSDKLTDRVSEQSTEAGYIE
jgi:hypothetical protein